MKRRMTKDMAGLLITMGTLLLTGCARDGTAPEEEYVATITPNNVGFVICGTYQMRVTLATPSGKTAAVDSAWWSTTDSQKARFIAGDWLYFRESTANLGIRAVVFSGRRTYVATAQVDILTTGQVCP